MVASHRTTNVRRAAGFALLLLGGLLGLALLLAWNRKPGREELKAEALEALRIGNVERLADSAERLRAFPELEPQAELLGGIAQLRSGHPDRSLSHLLASADHSEIRPLALCYLGECYYRLGRYPDCQRVLLEALEDDGNQVTARRYLAACYYDIGAMDLALEQLRIIARQAPADPRPHRLSARIYRDFEQYADALVHCDQALRLTGGGPDRQQLLLDKAECEFEMLQHAAALTTLEDVAPGAESESLRAMCEYSLGNMDAAHSAAMVALAQTPHHHRALTVLANLALAEGDTDSALERLEEAVKHHPEAFEIRYQLSGVYRQLGRDAEAEEQLAETERLKGLRREFTDLHLRAFRDTTDAGLRFRLGQLARELGKGDLAEQWFASALAIDPNHEEAGRELGNPPSNRQSNWIVN